MSAVGGGGRYHNTKKKQEPKEGGEGPEREVTGEETENKMQKKEDAKEGRSKKKK